MSGPSSSPFQFSVGWLLAYLAMLGLVAGGVIYGRAQAVATYGGQHAQGDWDAWREDVKTAAKVGSPVKRREPKSAEPPALVLMRDHFGACLGLALVLSSVLFGTFMLFVRGALSADPERDSYQPDA